jgi:hypothetical protein
MADCELEQAFDKVREKLPHEWFITNMVQRGDGWHVTVGKYDGLSDSDMPTVWPRLDTAAGTLTKALNRMADRLDAHTQGS